MKHILFLLLILIPSIASANTEIVVDRTTHRLSLYRDGEILNSYDVILGKPSTPTPAFETTFNSIDINPIWRPTDKSIKELRKDPKLAEHYGVIFGKNGVYAPAGEKNPLGIARLNLDYKVKIIRIHGTSQPQLFQTKSRDYSSGCIRVLYIRDLVMRIYPDYIDWDKSYTIKLSEVIHVIVK